MGIEYVLETLEPRIASISERRRRVGLIVTRHLPNEQSKAVTVSVDGGSIYLCDHLVDSDVATRILRDFIDLLLSEGGGISIRGPGD